MSMNVPSLRPFGFRNQGNIIIGLVALGLLAVVTLVPLLFIVYGSIGSGAWKEGVFSSPRTLQAIFYSFILALRAPFAAVIGFLIAWAIIRLELPGKSWIEFGFWIAFFIPSIPTTLGWILMLDPKSGLINEWLNSVSWLQWMHFDIYSLSGILWVHMTASSVPVMIILLGPALRNLDASLEESARTCGAPPRRFFFRITLPILAPAILAGALASFIRGLESFEVEQLLGVPVGIYVFGTRIFDLVNFEPPKIEQAMALSTLFLVVLFVLAAAYQQYALRSTHVTVSGRGASFIPLRVGKMRFVYSGLFFFILTVIVLVPLTSLIIGSFMKIFGFFNIPDPFTFKHWDLLLANRSFYNTLRNTFFLGLGAGIIGTICYSGLAYLIMRTQVIGRRWLDLLTWIPWAIPGVLLGFSILAIVLTVPIFSPLYGSLFLMMIAIAVAQMPIGVQMMKSSIGQISPDLEHSSLICGASRLTTLYRIVLPIIRPMLVSIFVLTFMSGMRDTSSVIFLYSGHSQVLSVLSLQYSITGNLGSAAAISVVMTTVIILVALLARFTGLNLGGHK